MVRSSSSFVLFDLDGTIWDSIPGIVGTLAFTLGELDVPVPDDETLASNVGPPLLEMLSHFGVAEAHLDHGRRIYRTKYAEWGEFECTLYPGATDLLSRLNEDGITLATATSKGVEPTIRMLEHFDVARHFDVVAAEPMTGDSAGKAGVVADALRRLAPSDPAGGRMVGDRHYDILAGRGAGLTTVGVRWGYGSAEEFAECEPDHIADDFVHLSRLLVSN